MNLRKNHPPSWFSRSPLPQCAIANCSPLPLSAKSFAKLVLCAAVIRFKPTRQRWNHARRAFCLVESRPNSADHHHSHTRVDGKRPGCGRKSPQSCPLTQSATGSWAGACILWSARIAVLIAVGRDLSVQGLRRLLPGIGPACSGAPGRWSCRRIGQLRKGRAWPCGRWRQPARWRLPPARASGTARSAQTVRRGLLPMWSRRWLHQQGHRHRKDHEHGRGA